MSKQFRKIAMQEHTNIQTIFFKFLLSLSLIALSILPLSTSAKDLPELITVTSTIYPPFIFEENGELKGIDFDTAREAGIRLGIDVELRLMPWLKINRNLKRGKTGLQAVVSYFKTNERTQYMDYTSIPIHVTKYKLFVRKTDNTQFNQLDDLINFKGKTIGVNTSFKTTSEFKQAIDNGTIKTEEVKTDKQNFLKLSSGRIDAVLTNFHVGSHLIKKLNLANKIKVLPESLSNTPAFLIFAKSANLKHLVPEFNRVLKEMQQDGTYQKIYQKYGVIIPK